METAEQITYLWIKRQGGGVAHVAGRYWGPICGGICTAGPSGAGQQLSVAPGYALPRVPACCRNISVTHQSWHGFAAQYKKHDWSTLRGQVSSSKHLSSRHIFLLDLFLHPEESLAAGH